MIEKGGVEDLKQTKQMQVFLPPNEYIKMISLINCAPSD